MSDVLIVRKMPDKRNRQNMRFDEFYINGEYQNSHDLSYAVPDCHHHDFTAPRTSTGFLFHEIERLDDKDTIRELIGTLNRRLEELADAD